MMYEAMRKALEKLGVLQRAYVPSEIQAALMLYGIELDRLGAEVLYLRSKIEKE